MRTTVFSLLICLVICAVAIAEPPREPAAPTKAAVPLFKGLGTHTRSIATAKPEAAKYFDQGLMFMFAFNHDEAVRAFRQATEIDPECAMAYWGIALASGVNYNNPSFPPERVKAAFEAVGKAKARMK